MINLIKLLKNLGIRPLILVLFLIAVLSVTFTMNVIKYFVSYEALASSDKILKNEIELQFENKYNRFTQVDNRLEQKLKQQQLESLYLQQQLIQQQVWNLDARVDDSITDERKNKWKRRLVRAEADLKRVKDNIKDLKEQ